MSLDTFATIRQRVNYLIGDTSATTSGIIDSHINSSIADICNAYPFSWNITQTTGVIAGSAPYFAFNLASDYNAKWHLHDARFIVSPAGVGADHIFQEIVINDRNIYALQTYKYYLTYDTTNHVYVFNTPETSGTVTYSYYFKPVALAALGDFCIVPDSEAVAYLAASKNWLTDERNQALMVAYKQEAATRIQSMWQTDNAFGPTPSEGTVVDYNQYLTRR